MLTGWRDGQIRSHDADTGRLLWNVDNAHAGGVTSLVLSHNQRFLVSGGAEGELRVWELRSRDLVSFGRAAMHHQLVPFCAGCSLWEVYTTHMEIWR